MSGQVRAADGTFNPRSLRSSVETAVRLLDGWPLTRPI